MNFILFFAMLITFILFGVAIKVREEYIEDLVYHEIKNEELQNSEKIILIQKEELLQINTNLRELSEQNKIMCGLDPKSECTLCNSDCLFKREVK